MTAKKKPTRAQKPKPTPPPSDSGEGRVERGETGSVPVSPLSTLPSPLLRNRVVERRRMLGSDLVPNEKNFREHPKEQTDALRAVLLELGQAGDLLAYYSERNAGKLTLIDGHLRSKDFPTEIWDVAITDLTDKEADKLLAVHDALTGMAATDPLKLGALVGDLDAETDELQKLLDQIGSEAGDVTFEDVSGESEGGAGSRNDGVTKMKVKIRPVLSVDQVRTFEEAIQATGQMARGEAINEICEAYLASHKKR